MADTPKTPPPPQPIEPGTIFIKNPGGTVHDMLEGTGAIVDRRKEGDDWRDVTVEDLARKSENGWRLASDKEIREYCERNNLIAPGTGAEAEASSAENATPAAAELAKASGVDLSTVKGTGADGTITKADVEAAAKKA